VSAPEPLKYAVNEHGRTVHVGAVPLGAACKCRCPRCDKPLIAKNRDHSHRRIALHFAHKGDCPENPHRPGLSARETILHRLAKQIVCERKRLAVPGCPMFPDGAIQDFRQPIFPRKIVFRNVKEEETRMADGPTRRFVPDLVCSTTTEEIHVEFLVTHAVTTEKRAAARQEGWTMLEIDLAPFANQDFNENELTAYLENRVEGRKWIAHSAGRELMRRIQRAAPRNPSRECPHGLGGVSHQTCDGCPYRLTRSDEPTSFRCTGTSLVKSLADLRRWESGGPLHLAPEVATRITDHKDQQARKLREQRRREGARRRQLQLEHLAELSLELKNAHMTLRYRKRLRLDHAHRELQVEIERLDAAVEKALRRKRKALDASADEVAKRHAARSALEKKAADNRAMWAQIADGTYRPKCAICRQTMILEKGNARAAARRYACLDRSHPKVDFTEPPARNPTNAPLQQSLFDS